MTFNPAATRNMDLASVTLAVSDNLDRTVGDVASNRQLLGKRNQAAIRRIYFKALMALAALLILLSAVSVIAAVWRLRNDAIANASRGAEEISTIVGEQTSNSLQSIELVMDQIIAEMGHTNSLNSVNYAKYVKTKDIYNYLLDRLTQIPHADVIAVTDANGNILNTTRDWPTPSVNVSEKDYFQYFQDLRDEKLYISQPSRSKVTGQWAIYFSKPVRTADGRNLGVVLIGIRPDAFLRTYSAISSIPGEVLVLLRTDGTLLLRQPDPVDRAGEKMPLRSDWYRLVRQGGGNYRSPGFFDGQPRWVAVKPLRRFPLVIDVSTSEAQILSAWRTRALAIVGLTVAIETGFAILLRMLYLQFGRLLRSEADLAAKSKEAEIANARFEAALSHMSNGLAMYDSEGQLVICNRKFEQLWGDARAEASLCAPRSATADPKGSAGFIENSRSTVFKDVPQPRPGEQGSTIVQLADGRSIRMTTDPTPDGGRVTTHEDITESLSAQAKIVQLAHHDALTGLANRTRFVSTFQECVRDKVLADFALVLIDLDRFKEVNDNFGHPVGDALLRLVAERLNATVGPDDLVARLGGDEFAILCDSNSSSADDVQTLAERIVAAVHAPYSIGENELSIGLSIGIALANADASAEQMMRHADLALYRAKNEGRNRFLFFESRMEEDFQSRQQLTRELQAAIERNELQVHYQPIVNAGTFEVETMEALARWPLPTGGMVSPKLFIELAEESGLIHVLGEWVLRQACFDAAGWPARIKIAVNVSAIQINRKSFPDVVAGILEETGLSPSRLQLEITESILLSDSDHALSILQALKTSGVAIVLDDFGTGYSSLSYLKTFPFDEIKIDKSFIDDMAASRGCAALVAAMTTLARGFDIATTAEGVETKEQCELLRAAAVTQMQGYLFGKPAPAAAWDFTRSLAVAGSCRAQM